MTDPSATDSAPLPSHGAGPRAPREPVDASVHGDPREDDYAWLRDRDDPRTLPHLQAENAHTAAWFAPHAALQERLYEEMLGRIQQDDESVPYRLGRWWYGSRTREGEAYPLYFRRAAVGVDRHHDPAAAEETMLDLNRMAAGLPYLSLGEMAVSTDGRWLAYSTDRTGGRDYVLSIRDLTTGMDLPFQMADVDSVAWANDNRTLYAVTVDEAKRAHRLWRVQPFSEALATLIYEETDALYDIDIAKTRDQRYLLLQIGSMDTSEVRLLDASRNDRPLRMLFARCEGIEFDVDHRAGQFYLRINDVGPNFRVLRVDARRPALARAEVLLPYREDVIVDDIDVFAAHLVVTERAGGSLQLRVLDLARGTNHLVALDEAPCTVGGSGNAEFDTAVFRFSLGSLAIPRSVYDYDMATRERVLRKRQPVRGGYEPADYATERVVARAPDGTEVPISVVYRRDLRGSGPQPLLLYGYGAYGIPSDPWFSSTRLSLLDRGVIYAIAHVRGGGEGGRAWYEAGKMEHKARSFGDFVACAEHLVAAGWTAPDRLAIEGASAGGLLVAAAVNLRPDLFHAVIAEVPFVDVINTMLDESLPLTVGEFIEWGNPKEPEEYAWLRAYSPYDNLKPGAYPAFFVRTGINDSQVAYWEPAKYVARLRTLKTDARPLLLKVNLEVGHGGASGRYDALRESAEDVCFLLVEWGLAA